MKTCKVCGREYRSGKVAHVIDEAENLKKARVCKPCAEAGITIVLKRPPLRPQGARTVRNPQLDAIKRRLTTLRKIACEDNRGNYDFTNGQIAGLDSAIALIQAAQESRPL
jgi:hypothetical protein